MLIRTLSTLMLWGLVFGTIYLFEESGGIWLLTLAAFLTQAEIYSMLTRMNQRPLRFEGLVIGTVVIPFTFYFESVTAEDILAAAVVLTVAATLFRTSGREFSPSSQYLWYRWTPLSIPIPMIVGSATIL